MNTNDKLFEAVETAVSAYTDIYDGISPVDGAIKAAILAADAILHPSADKLADYVLVPRNLPYAVLGDAAIAGVFDTGNPKHGWDYLLSRVAAPAPPGKKGRAAISSLAVDLLARHMRAIDKKHNAPGLAADADVLEEGAEWDFWMEAAHAAVSEALTAAPAPAVGIDTKLEFLKDPENVLSLMLKGVIAVPTIRSMVKLRGEVLNGEDALLARIAELQEQLSNQNIPRQFVDSVKQLCKDFSDLQNRPYMGDVYAQLDGLLEHEGIEIEQAPAVGGDAIRARVVKAVPGMNRVTLHLLEPGTPDWLDPGCIAYVADNPPATQGDALDYLFECIEWNRGIEAIQAAAEKVKDCMHATQGDASLTHGNLGHGHVYPRPDGAKARCGGPGMCAECSKDAAIAAQAGGEG